MWGVLAPAAVKTDQYGCDRVELGLCEAGRGGLAQVDREKPSSSAVPAFSAHTLSLSPTASSPHGPCTAGQPASQVDTPTSIHKNTVQMHKYDLVLCTDKSQAPLRHM